MFLSPHDHTDLSQGLEPLLGNMEAPQCRDGHQQVIQPFCDQEGHSPK